tara:strand:+ start:3396 stop:5801 length:2406 start_codon:yes stop_codon:yes gene_type:complete
MAVEIRNSPLTQALDSLTRMAEGYVERAQTNRMQTEARREEMNMQLEMNEKKLKQEHTYNRLLKVNPEDMVYGKDQEIDMNASIKKSANREKWISNGKNTALWQHAYFAEDIDFDKGTLTDTTPGTYTSNELDTDDRMINGLFKKEELSDFEVNSLVHYGLLHEGDDQLELNGNMLDIAATVRSRWQDPEDRAELIDVLQNRWSLTKEGIRNSNPSFQTESNYIKHANEKLDYNNAQIESIENSNSFQTLKTSLSSVSTKFAGEDLQIGSWNVRTVDDGKIKMRDRDNNPISVEDFRTKYKIVSQILDSPDPTATLARELANVPGDTKAQKQENRNKFLAEIRKESPEVFEYLSNSLDDLTDYGIHQNAINLIRQSGLNRTTVNISEGYNLSDALNSMQGNYIQNTLNLSKKEASEKSDMAFNAKLPPEYINANLDVLKEDSEENMIQKYKEDTINVLTSNPKWKEEIYILENNNASYKEDLGPEITVKEIFEHMDAGNENGDNFLEYEEFKSQLGRQEKEMLNSYTTKNPGLYTSEEVTKQAKSYESSLRALGDIIEIGNAAEVELGTVQSEIDGLIGVFNDGKTSLKINAVQHLRTTEGKHIEERLNELMSQRNLLVESITGSPDARRDVGDFGVRTAKDLLLADTPGMESIYAGESPIVDSLLGLDASDSMLRGRSLPVDFMSKDSYLPVKTGRRTMIGAKGYTGVGGEVMPLSSISSDVDPSLGVGDNLVRLQKLADQGNPQAAAILQAEEDRRVLQQMTSEDIGALPDLYQSDAVLELIDDVFGLKKPQMSVGQSE